MLFYSFTEFYGVDKAKHGESAYPMSAWVENQYNEVKSVPIGPVGKTVENTNNLMNSDSSKRKLTASHQDIVDPIETTSSIGDLRKEHSTSTTLDPSILLKEMKY